MSNLFDNLPADSGLALAPDPDQAEREAAPRSYRLAPENPELVLRDAVLAALEGRYHSLLEYLRRRLRGLYEQRLERQGRELAHVTADDARLILDSDPNVPPPDRLCRNFLGQLFRSPGWQATGSIIRSHTAGSHGNLLFCWRFEPQSATLPTRKQA